LVEGATVALTACGNRSKIGCSTGEVHLRSLLIAAAVAAAASLADVAQSTASAAPPVAVEIQAHPLSFFPIELGTWTASGGIDDLGGYVRTDVQTSPPDRPFGVPGPFKEVFVFTSSQGTFTVQAEERDTGTEITGPWQIVSGTGGYEDASGHGTVAFSAFPPPLLTLTLTGVVSKVGDG
jgi:hypothetical protein